MPPILTATMLDIKIAYAKKINGTLLKTHTLSISEDTTLESLIQQITKEISCKEEGFVISSCENGMAKNLLDKKLQSCLLKEISRSKELSLWINC